jgi:hypothetical protein
MAVRTINSTPPKKCTAKTCIMQPSKEIDFLSWRESTIIFGVVTEEKHASRKDRNAKKKYIGTCSSVGLQTMVTTIRMLLPIVAM